MSRSSVFVWKIFILLNTQMIINLMFINKFPKTIINYHLSISLEIFL